MHSRQHKHITDMDTGTDSLLFVVVPVIVKIKKSHTYFYSFDFVHLPLGFMFSRY